MNNRVLEFHNCVIATRQTALGTISKVTAENIVSHYTAERTRNWDLSTL